MKNTPDAPRNDNGLVQMIRMGKSISHKWVKDTVLSYQGQLLIIRDSLGCRRLGVQPPTSGTFSVVEIWS